MFAVVRRHPEFRRLWLAQVTSQCGDWLNRIAILTLIGRLGSAGHLAGVGALFGVELAIRMLPSAVFGPIAGPLADRLPRRLVMITSDVLRAVVVLGFLTVDAPGEIPVLYGLLVLQTSLTIFFTAARSASVPETVPRSELHAAYALSAATWSAMLAVGAALGGVLVLLIGTDGVFLADAATFLVSAWILTRLRLPPAPKHPQPLRARDILLFTDMRRAIAHARERSLLPVLAAKTLWGSAGGFLVLLSVAAKDRFGEAGSTEAALGAAGFATGVLYAARGLGTGVGPLLGRRFFGSSERSLRFQIGWGYLIGAAGYAVLALSHSLTWAFVWVALAHTGGSTIWVASTTWWQGRVENAFRGRVFSLEFLGMTVSFTAGGLLAGWLYDRTGSLEQALWIHCGLVLLGGGIWMYLVRHTPLDGPREDPEGRAVTIETS